jgi:hypothetical protein
VPAPVAPAAPTAAIERGIEAILAEDEPDRDRVREAVRQHRFLPVFHGLTGLHGLRPDGTVVRWDLDDEPPAPAPVRERDPFWIRLTLARAADQHPDLAVLRPPRPARAIDCTTCRGAGTFPIYSAIVCSCGGLGWRLPGSAPPP